MRKKGIHLPTTTTTSRANTDNRGDQAKVKLLSTRLISLGVCPCPFARKSGWDRVVRVGRNPMMRGRRLLWRRHLDPLPPSLPSTYGSTWMPEVQRPFSLVVCLVSDGAVLVRVPVLRFGPLPPSRCCLHRAHPFFFALHYTIPFYILPEASMEDTLSVLITSPLVVSSQLVFGVSMSLDSFPIVPVFVCPICVRVGVSPNLIESVVILLFPLTMSNLSVPRTWLRKRTAWSKVGLAGKSFPRARIEGDCWGRTTGF